MAFDILVKKDVLSLSQLYFGCFAMFSNEMAVNDFQTALQVPV
jgi:hypothetical protein